MPGHPARMGIARVVGFLVGVAVFWWIWSSVLPGEKVVVEPQVKQTEPKGPKGCPDKEFTVDQVMEHQKCNFNMAEFDLWLVIDQKVYKVDDWAPRHPGGAMICAAVGIDSTNMFNNNHHESWIKESALPEWCIGRLKEGEKMPGKDTVKDKDTKDTKDSHAGHNHGH